MDRTSIHEKIVEILTADGRMETFITHPEQGGPFAPVVVYMDVWGLREELYDIARKVAVAGYYVVLPDLYYRQGRIRHQWRNERGQMISMHNLEPERQAQVRAPLQKLTDAMVVAHSGAILDFLAKGEPVRQIGVGSIGYCMGGRHVMCVAGGYELAGSGGPFLERLVGKALEHKLRRRPDVDLPDRDLTPKPIAPRPSQSLMPVDQRGQFLAPVVLRGEQILLVLASRKRRVSALIDLATASNQPVPRHG